MIFRGHKMSNNELTIKGSFYGIIGELLKRLLLLFSYWLIFIIANNYRKANYSKQDLSSLIKLITDNKLLDAFIFVVIFVLFILLAFLTFSSVLKTIKLFYNINRRVTVDFFQSKITLVSYSFPFFKNVEENKFDNIITVNIEQALMDRFFNSGKLYIEYLVCSKVDSSSVSFEIPHVFRPSKILKELMK